MAKVIPSRAKARLIEKQKERGPVALRIGFTSKASLDNCLKDKNPHPISRSALILLAQELETTVEYLTGQSDDPNPKKGKVA